MTFLWVICLGAMIVFRGWESVPLIDWLLLVPFAARDIRANQHNGRTNLLAVGLSKVIEVIMNSEDVESMTVEQLIDRQIALTVERKNGYQSHPIQLALNPKQQEELRVMADKEGKTEDEMLIELLSRQMSKQGGTLVDAKVMKRPGGK